MEIMRNYKSNKNEKSGQSMVEYTILFTVIVAVVVAAITTFFAPALNGFYVRTSGVLNDINPMLINSH